MEYLLFRDRTEKTPVPDNFVKDGRRTLAVPPCFTAVVCRALCGVPTYSRQLTYAHTSRNTRRNAVPRALSGPFDRQFLTQLSAPRALCRGIAAVISASTVLFDSIMGQSIASDFSVVKENVAVSCPERQPQMVFVRLVRYIFAIGFPPLWRLTAAWPVSRRQ